MAVKFTNYKNEIHIHIFYTNVNALLLRLYSSYIECNQWKKLVDVYVGLFSMFQNNPVLTYEDWPKSAIRLKKESETDLRLQRVQFIGRLTDGIMVLGSSETIWISVI